MNIVLTTDYFPPHVGGGVERVTFHVASELIRLGHKVAVVTLNTCRARTCEMLNGIRVYRANLVELTRTLGMQSAISFEALKLIHEAYCKEAADILHANNLFFCTTIAACASKRPLQTRLVTTLHVGSTSELEGGIRLLAALYEKSIGRWVLNKSDHVVAVSQAVKQYAESLGTPSSKISVVPNAVDLQDFRPDARESELDGTVRVAFIGRLISNKGPQYLVEAAPRILRDFPGVQFLLVGEGPMFEQLRRRAEHLGLRNHFRFLGVVPSVSQFLKNCDILVRPSLTEGMPLTVLEAMACGVPTVASKVGGTPEILLHGETGFLVEPKNIDQLSFYISRLVGDDELRTVMGKRARSLIEKYCSWDEVARKMSRIYDSVLERS